MSDESDLEFESADEGLKGEDIDTDDLIEDDENVVEKKVISVKAEGEQTEKKETDLLHTKIVEIDSEKEIAAKLEETRLVNDDKTQTKGSVIFNITKQLNRQKTCIICMCIVYCRYTQYANTHHFTVLFFCI